jgi:hypothetical protein
MRINMITYSCTRKRDRELLATTDYVLKAARRIFGVRMARQEHQGFFKFLQFAYAPNEFNKLLNAAEFKFITLNVENFHCI